MCPTDLDIPYEAVIQPTCSTKRLVSSKEVWSSEIVCLAERQDQIMVEHGLDAIYYAYMSSCYNEFQNNY